MVTTFAVHQLVKVAQRQWPGVNKEGGDARVVQMNEDGTVAVAYIIGNRSEASVHVKVRSTALPGRSAGYLDFWLCGSWWAPKKLLRYFVLPENRQQMQQVEQMQHTSRANFEL